jgi:hypothetical protein
VEPWKKVVWEIRGRRLKKSCKEGSLARLARVVSEVLSTYNVVEGAQRRSPAPAGVTIMAAT